MPDRKRFLQLLGLGGLAGLRIPALTATGNPPAKRVIKPPALNRGDTIGLVSPAGSLETTDRYDEIEEEIRKLGFHVKTGQHARDRYGYLAGDDTARASDLNAMFSDPGIDAVIPFRGGWGSNRILDQIDYEAIKEHPKPIIGFSDITSLLLAIHAKTDLVTFHGPVGKSSWTEYTVRHFRKAVNSGIPFTVNPRTGLSENGDDGINIITGGDAEGPLLGGNLSVLTSMLGSDYLPDFSGAILFLEDVGEDIYRVDRMITQLKLNGILDEISGFVFGRCTDCEPGSLPSLSLEEVLRDHVGSLGVPAFTGTNIGHIDNMVTLPVGIPARIDSRRGIIKTLESATE